MMDNRCIIFPHIPKCGGSSLKSQLETSNLKVYFDYDWPPNNNKYFRKQCERRNREASLLDFGGFDVVFGHFPAERYIRDNYRYVTLMRHPVDRAVSHYSYWKNVLPKSNALALSRYPIIQQIKQGKVGFLEFTKAQKLNGYYAMYLSRRLPQDFLLVGFLDEYASFLHQLSDILCVQFSPNVHFRQGMKESIALEDRQKAEAFMAPEISCYEAFRDYWVTGMSRR